jgi:hypothetical protein
MRMEHKRRCKMKLKQAIKELKMMLKENGDVELAVAHYDGSRGFPVEIRAETLIIHDSDNENTAHEDLVITIL